MKALIRIVNLPIIPSVDLKPHERWMVFPVLAIELALVLFVGFALFSGLVTTLHGILK